jgi:hemerythrin-like domain-containing protein
LAGAALGIGGAAGRTLLAADAAQPAEDVSAVEDLMREHGVLRRILLIYEECARRFRKNELNDAPNALMLATKLVQKFVEEYHELLEEKFIFPEFENRSQLVSLVKILREQHAAGRRLTHFLSETLSTTGYLSAKVNEGIAAACEAFIRMYRPHAAREDTVLFPALKKILSAKQLDALGDKFEDEENRRFGADGFGKTVEKVAEIEKVLGIYDLGQFTPKLKK